MLSSISRTQALHIFFIMLITFLDHLFPSRSLALSLLCVCCSKIKKSPFVYSFSMCSHFSQENKSGNKAKIRREMYTLPDNDAGSNGS